ncbi:hypothetical protein Bbelb_083540 [Branchiostoma belcheri]|nr:hypothetical protein Bbelb_083540 [Branchiostoma belcheri]
MAVVATYCGCPPLVSRPNADVVPPEAKQEEPVKTPLVPGRGSNPRPNPGTSPQADTLTSPLKGLDPFAESPTLMQSLRDQCLSLFVPLYVSQRKATVLVYQLVRYYEQHALPGRAYVL